MNLINNIPSSAGFEETLKHLAEEGTLVDIFLRSYPMDYEVPKEILENTRSVRIIQVSKGCIIVGPKRPLVTSVIPIDEITMVSISAKPYRDDEDEIDRKIEEEHPEWERDFARLLEAMVLGRRLAGDVDENQIQDETGPLAVIQKSKYVVLDVFATWCQPCKEIEVILEELENKYGDKVHFAKLNGDENAKAAEDLDVGAYPTVILFEDGEIRKKIVGSRGIEYYENEIEILIRQKERVRKPKAEANGKVNMLPSDRLIEVMEEGPAVVIMFYERGDEECQMQSRVMNELAKEYKKRVVFAKVDVDKEDELADAFEVEYIPEVFFIIDGAVSSFSEERLTKTELREGIEKLLRQ